MVDKPVTYEYDQGSLGVGYRTRMADRTGVSSWTYDERGRMVGETRTITGTGTFATAWTYTHRDDLWQQSYPANNSGGLGEQVTI